MKADEIKIIETIGKTLPTMDGTVKEVNLVESRIDGDLFYDIREWSADHSECYEGISFTEKEYLALTSAIKAYRPKPVPGSVETELIPRLQELGLEFADKRAAGGALWVVGGHELDALMNEFEAAGQKFLYSEKGGRATKNRPSWYLKSN